MMIGELERVWKEEVVGLLRYYPGICLEGHENYKAPCKDRFDEGISHVQV